MSGWRLGFVGVLIMAVSGCQEPTQIVPVAAPGTAPPRPALPESAPPAAFGESREQLEALEKKKAELAALPPAPPTPRGETRTTRSGVKYETLKEGTGPEARTGQKVTVHYTGSLDDGKTFDSSYKNGEPFTFQLGQGAVIRGWEEAIKGMRVGEKRRLTIPPEAGYGAEGREPEIPPDATLHFDIELLGVE